MRTRTPPVLKPFIQQFCKSIVPDQEPFYVPVQPLPNKPVDECFRIVPEHIAAHGGKQVFGWYIGVWPKVLIEAAFHAVWQTEDGRFIDITPKPGIESILFLPDPHRKYKGRRIDNIRKPLTGDKRIYKFCSLAEQLFLIENEGNLPYQNGIEFTPASAMTWIKIKNAMQELHRAISRKYG